MCKLYRRAMYVSCLVERLFLTLSHWPWPIAMYMIYTYPLYPIRWDKWGHGHQLVFLLSVVLLANSVVYHALGSIDGTCPALVSVSAAKGLHGNDWSTAFLMLPIVELQVLHPKPSRFKDYITLFNYALFALVIWLLIDSMALILFLYTIYMSLFSIAVAIVYIQRDGLGLDWDGLTRDPVWGIVALVCAPVAGFGFFFNGLYWLFHSIWHMAGAFAAGIAFGPAWKEWRGRKQIETAAVGTGTGTTLTTSSAR